MEELIPFIFFILWFLFGGLGSKKKREEAQRRAEAQREAQEAARRARAEQRRAMRESREADGRLTYGEAGGGGFFEEPKPAAPTTSDSSVDMIPDELWTILTGGAPRPTRPQPETAEYPPSDGGWVTSPPYDEEDAVHSIEGVSAETSVEDAVDYDDDASRYARARYEAVRATTWEDRPSRESVAVRTSETSEARHDEFHDRLAASEIGRAGPEQRISARERLGLRNLSDVRRAIVLTEVLGPPKSLQRSFTEGWRGERPPRVPNK